jgi:hypothetical protein
MALHGDDCRVVRDGAADAMGQASSALRPASGSAAAALASGREHTLSSLNTRRAVPRAEPGRDRQRREATHA